MEESKPKPLHTFVKGDYCTLNKYPNDGVWKVLGVVDGLALLKNRYDWRTYQKVEDLTLKIMRNEKENCNANSNM